MEKFLYTSTSKKLSNFAMWIAYPGPYSFSMSSLGYLWLFKIIDEAGIDIERITSDTTKTYHNPKDINLIGFSFSFDMDFINIFSMLEKYNIPLKAKDREKFPLIFAGGPVASLNPEPYKDFFDFFVIGDGEDVNLEVVKICKNNQNKSKKEILEILSNIEGVYVPYLSTKVTKVTKRISDCVYTPILSDNSFFKNTFILEVARGCANRCGFCVASYLNLPLRCLPYEELIRVIELGLKYTNKIALLGAEISAHPHFHDICKFIYKKIKSGENIEMGVSSLRVDAITPEVIQTLSAAGQKNTTLAIEAGSERLRRVINKNLTEEQIFNAVKLARENGLRGFKFYGMIGIPTETQEDIYAIITLAQRLKKENKGFDISFGFSTFVPKPHTPFQWFGREDTQSVDKKCNYLKKEMHKLGINTNVSSIKWDYWQAVLSRGDERLSDFLLEVYNQGGKLGAFKSVAKKLKIDTDYYAYENYDINKSLPWDFIDLRPGKDFLKQENKKLIQYS